MSRDRGRQLAGKVAVVTGASRGIGAAISRALAAAGAEVIAGSRARPAEPYPPGVTHVRADVADPSQVRTLIASAAEHGRLDILVNNAAIEYEGTVEETELEDWDRVMEVNVRAVFLCTREAIPHMRRSGGGSIINIGSIDGHWAEPGLAAYCASKGAVMALTRAIAIDHGRDGIRCTCICPSYVATEMLDQYFDAQPDPAAARHAAARRHPAGRICTPDEVAALAVWLAGDEARFASGHPFVLDGALTAGRAR